MEIPGTAAPWLVLGLALGLLLAALGVLSVPALRRPSAPDDGPTTEPPPAGPVVDDLPGFLEFPPGSRPAPPVRDAGWLPLAPVSPPPPAPAVAPSRPQRSGTTGMLVAMALTAALLIGAAAAVAATRGADDPAPADGAPAAGPQSGSPAGPAPGTVSADLAFESVVLERHAVGVTVALPQVRVTTVDGRTTAQLELTTFNCLRDVAPPDPASAGCSRSVVEYAELATPRLGVAADGRTVRLTGAFPTERRPTGSAPVMTGRVYEVVVTASPRDGGADDDLVPATGWFEIGGERASTRDDGSSVLSVGD